QNLEDIDAKIELIRMLQPDFDQVQVFQMWNKAFNLSVQVSSSPNKYAAVVDALEYGRRVDSERPDNVNILFETARIYFDKLNSSMEKSYYIDRVRQESKFALDTDSSARTLQKQRLDPLL